MATCGNLIIRNFLQKTKIEYATDDDECLPDCTNWGYHLDEVTYNEDQFIKSKYIETINL